MVNFIRDLQDIVSGREPVLLNGKPMETGRDAARMLGLILGICICITALVIAISMAVREAARANPPDVIVGVLLAVIMGLVVVGVWPGASRRQRSVVAVVLGVLMVLGADQLIQMARLL